MEDISMEQVIKLLRLYNEVFANVFSLILENVDRHREERHEQPLHHAEAKEEGGDGVRHRERICHASVAAPLREELFQHHAEQCEGANVGRRAEEEIVSLVIEPSPIITQEIF